MSNHASDSAQLVSATLRHCPDVQAIYLFGSWATEYESPDSDTDVALLLPVLQAKAMQTLYGTALHRDLERLLRRDVDLINLRAVSSVLQKEVIAAERRIWCANPNAADEFEMLALSLYQKLNDERAEIIAAVRQSGWAVAA